MLHRRKGAHRTIGDAIDELALVTLVLFLSHMALREEARFCVEAPALVKCGNSLRRKCRLLGSNVLGELEVKMSWHLRCKHICSDAKHHPLQR